MIAPWRWFFVLILTGALRGRWSASLCFSWTWLHHNPSLRCMALLCFLVCGFSAPAHVVVLDASRPWCVMVSLPPGARHGLRASWCASWYLYTLSCISYCHSAYHLSWSSLGPWCVSCSLVPLVVRLVLPGLLLVRLDVPVLGAPRCVPRCPRSAFRALRPNCTRVRLCATVCLVVSCALRVRSGAPRFRWCAVT